MFQKKKKDGMCLFTFILNNFPVNPLKWHFPDYFKYITWGWRMSLGTRVSRRQMMEVREHSCLPAATQNPQPLQCQPFKVNFSQNGWNQKHYHLTLILINNKLRKQYIFKPKNGCDYMYLYIFCLLAKEHEILPSTTQCPWEDMNIIFCWQTIHKRF